MSKSLLESEFVEHLRTLKPDAATVAQFPAIAAEVWSRRQGNRSDTTGQLTARLEEQKKLKAELLRAKLRGEVNQTDYAQANAEFDSEIEAITEQLQAVQSQGATLDEFVGFAKLMLVDIAMAWQKADIEQRVRVQNFLFCAGVAYHENQKFLNTSKPTLFQQLRTLTNPQSMVGVPDGI